MNPKLILIAEDDDFLRSLATTKLQKAGFEVQTAANGQVALDLIKTKLPQLLLLDLMMPVVDGFQVLATMKNEAMIEKTEIIVFSNLGAEEDIRRVQEFGVKNYIVKSSFTLDELVAKIEEVLK